MFFRNVVAFDHAKQIIKIISLVFTEPDLALSLASRSAAVAVVRVHLSLGARPPWLSDADGPGLFASFVELRLTRDALAAAVASWDQELLAFPPR